MLRSLRSSRLVGMALVALALHTNADLYAQDPPPNPFGPPTGDPAAAQAPPTDAGAPPNNPFGNVQGTLTDIANQITGARANALANPEPVRQLFEFRYVQETRWDGKPIVRRKRLTYEEAQAYDKQQITAFEEAARAGTLPFYPGSGATGAAQPGQEGTANPAGPVDVKVFSEWAYYAEQLALWGEYTRLTIFTDEIPEMTVRDVRWPGDPAPGAQNGQQGQQQFVSREGSTERLVEQTQNRSLDSQLGDFFTVGGGGGSTARTWTAADINRQVVSLWEQYNERLDAIEKRHNDFVVAFAGRLSERAAAREAYSEWRRDQQVQLLDLVNDWSRRFDGSVSIIEGVRYELYKPGEVPSAVPRGTYVVETNARLTPFDILDQDGRLRVAPPE